MAVTGLRLLTGALRKPDAWLGLWGVLQGTSPHKLCASWNRYLYFSSSKLNALNYKTLFRSIFPLRLPGLLVAPKCTFPFSIRLKSNINSKKSTRKTLQKDADEEDSDEEIHHPERSEQEEELEDDPGVVKDYKDLEKVVQSFRYDVILKTGLDIGRNKVEDAFYKGELRLNGEKLWKKSRTVSHPACNDSHMVLTVALLVSAVPNSPLGPGALSEGFRPGHTGGNHLWATVSSVFMTL
ncbi:uncharacterized protein C6orf203 homolog [Microtus ochrogaster]|uniref:Uncharacterized protein C6orf203 homolog n=1 Tax=Microtus ochrogaster TaxID=79684 RepID=A0ABM1UMB0_MICOH|nr:uncharacterized protein C6orf203 homolog [Microtus ochrogaster]XP_026643122.1 uncharacterized protein C6orf203 homolog [Microtus ochrogaster]